MKLRLKKTLWLACGCLATLLGAVGIALPVLPTTPFLLLAIFCFERSSPHLRRRLLESRILGSYLRRYLYQRGLTLREKIVTLTGLWLGLGLAAWGLESLWWGVLLGVIGVGVSLHILLLRTLSGAEKSPTLQELQLLSLEPGRRG